jgi:hypothetical protein
MNIYSKLLETHITTNDLDLGHWKLFAFRDLEFGIF